MCILVNVTFNIDVICYQFFFLSFSNFAAKVTLTEQKQLVVLSD